MMVTVVWRFDKLESSRKRHRLFDKTYSRSNGFIGKARVVCARTGDLEFGTTGRLFRSSSDTLGSSRRRCGLTDKRSTLESGTVAMATMAMVTMVMAHV